MQRIVNTTLKPDYMENVLLPFYHNYGIILIRGIIMGYKKFTERINGDWYSSERLSELLDEFFEDTDEPKTLTHLYCWLNTDWVTIMQRREINDEYRKLIDAAMNECEKWVVDHGFANDKSFAKFTLQTQHNRAVTSVAEVKVSEADKCYLPMKDESN